MKEDKKKPFIPDYLPPKEILWESLIPLIGDANRGIARYDGLLSGLINPIVLLSPLTTNEAVISSRIEGTQASLEDVLEMEAGINQKHKSIKADIQEIINYRQALLFAEQELQNRNITLNLIKQIHFLLMSNVRGKDKKPGEFRKTQNWIGNRGTPLEKARYIPPEPLLVSEYMEKLVKFIQSNFLDRIVQLAIIHAQFEIIHPFLDGNGRIGRLLIPLFLYSKKLLSKPAFYISEYFEKNRNEYYDRLLGITEEHDWQRWIEFFLKAVILQAEDNIFKAKRIMKLYDQLKNKFIEITHSQFAIPLLDAFFTRPIIDTTSILKITGISNRVTVNELLKKLNRTENPPIRPIIKGTGRQPSVYILSELINIVEGKNLI